MEGFEYTSALVSGGVAGLSVDVALFPLDTIKTRLQSSAGFLKSGGFRGIYSGLQTAAIGSAPTAAMFFVSYESSKDYLSSRTNDKYKAFVHMASAAVGETMACLVRVPCEIIKQRAQASPGSSQLAILRTTIRAEGLFGLYRGYVSTITREIPFSFIQFPLWELMKSEWEEHQGRHVDPWQSAVCGSISGGVSAALTTPLDVAKTRIMLAQSGSSLAKGSIMMSLLTIYRQNGFSGLFAGLTARVPLIAVGGAVFLGAYDKVRQCFIDWR